MDGEHGTVQYSTVQYSTVQYTDLGLYPLAGRPALHLQPPHIVIVPSPLLAVTRHLHTGEIKYFWIEGDTFGLAALVLAVRMRSSGVDLVVVGRHEGPHVVAVEVTPRADVLQPHQVPVPHQRLAPRPRVPRPPLHEEVVVLVPA